MGVKATASSEMPSASFCVYTLQGISIEILAYTAGRSCHQTCYAKSWLLPCRLAMLCEKAGTTMHRPFRYPHLPLLLLVCTLMGLSQHLHWKVFRGNVVRFRGEGHHPILGINVPTHLLGAYMDCLGGLCNSPVENGPRDDNSFVLVRIHTRARAKRSTSGLPWGKQ